MSDNRQILYECEIAGAMSAAAAAKLAGVHRNTIHRWCEVYGVGRRIGCHFRISRIALDMFMSGDKPALATYHAGDFGNEEIAGYIAKHGSFLFARPAGLALFAPTASSALTTKQAA